MNNEFQQMWAELKNLWNHALTWAPYTSPMHNSTNLQFLRLQQIFFDLVKGFSQTGSMLSFVFSRSNCHLSNYDDIILIYWIKSD